MRWWLALCVGCSAAPGADRTVATVDVEPSAAGAEPADDDEEPAAITVPQAKCEAHGAEMLFDQGKELLTQGRFEEACAKLEASHQCDGAVGTLLNLSVCYERLGDTPRACEKLKAALAIGADDTRRQYIQQRAHSLGC